MSEEVLNKAREIAVKLRELERDALKGGEGLRDRLRQIAKEAREAGLYKSFAHLFRKVERLVESREKGQRGGPTIISQSRSSNTSSPYS